MGAEFAFEIDFCLEAMGSYDGVDIQDTSHRRAEVIRSRPDSEHLHNSRTVLTTLQIDK